MLHSHSLKYGCVLFTFVILIAGCGQSKVDPNKFQLEAETVLDSETMKIYRLILTINGEKKVTLSQGPSAYSSVYGGSAGESWQCEILLIADLVRQSEELNLVKWYRRVEAQGRSAGGPSVTQVPQDQSLEDLLDISMQAGEFTTNSDIHLATFKGKKLTVNVE